MKLKRLKTAVAAMVLAAVTMSTSVPVYAAEISDQEASVEENAERSTIFVFGGAIVMVYPNGTMEIIPNNPAGKVDIMIAGKLYKGMGRMTVLPKETDVSPNMVLEENSIVMKGVTADNAASVRQMVADSQTGSVAAETLANIAGTDASASSQILTVNKDGNLKTPDGNVISAKDTGIAVKNMETAYEEQEEALAEAKKEQEEKRAQEDALTETAKEQEDVDLNDTTANADQKQESSNTDNKTESSEGVESGEGECLHVNKTLHHSKLWIGKPSDDGRGKYVNEWYKCDTCGIAMYNGNDIIDHTEHSLSYDGQIVSLLYEDETLDMIVGCVIAQKSSCDCGYSIYDSKDSIPTMHATLPDGEFCPTCGYDKNGNHADFSGES